jgi:DNA invertase Pin-like site-specific DNA recombinase
MVYGYARISTKQQSIDRQIRNIKAAYPEAVIVQEAWSGTKIERPEWSKLYKQAKAGDLIVFDSVSRMSRNAADGVQTYFDLYDRGVELVFLKEAHINTSVYSESLTDKITLTGTDEDLIFAGINAYMKRLAEKQIILAFEQAQKEVDDLHQRTKEGIETARLAGKPIGQQQGRKLNVKKAAAAKEIIRKHSKDFAGTLSDPEVMRLAGVSRNSYYKYKAELREE